MDGAPADGFDPALLSRDAILEAVAFAAQRLLTGSDWRQAVQEVLEHYGRAAQVSRIYVFRVQPADDGEVLASLQWEWAIEGLQPEPGRVALQNYPLVATGLGRWVTALQSGQVVAGHTRELSTCERGALEYQGVLSVVLAPVFVAQTWWGFVGFDECLRERVWSDLELEALRVAASTLGAAIHRNLSEERVQQSEERFRQVLDVSRELIYRLDLASGDFDYISPSCRDVTGFTVAELQAMGRPLVRARMHPDDQEPQGKRYAQLLQGTLAEVPTEIEYRWRCKDGAYRWLADSPTAVRDPQGHAVAVVGALRDVTERRRAAEALHASQERYRMLVETMAEGLAFCDWEGTIVYVNDRVCELLGYERDELLGHNPADFMDDHNYHLTLEHARRRMEGHAGAFEVEIIRCDGNRVSVSISPRDLYDEQQQFAGSLFVLTDITERKRAEAELRRYNAELALLAQSGIELAEIPTLEAAYQFVCDRLRELAGALYVSVNVYDPDTETMRTRALSGPEGWRERATAMADMSPSWRDCRQDEQAGAAVRWLHRLDDTCSFAGLRLPPADSERWRRELGFGDIYAVGFGRGGELLGEAMLYLPPGARIERAHVVETFVHMVTTLLLRQRAESALRESELRYRSLFEEIGDAFILLDDDLHIDDCRNMEVLGLVGNASLGADLAEGLPALVAAIPRLSEILRNVLVLGESFTLHGLQYALATHMPGAAQYLDVLAYRVAMSGRQRVALLCRDVSELHRLEAELREAQSLEALGRFASGVAHDFGNLLAVIIQECDLLEGMLEPEGQERVELDQILQAARSGQGITRQLLALSHGETIESEIVHLNRLILDLEGLVRRILGESVELRLKLSEEAIFFWGDPQQFNRVILNLVYNAREAMPSGGRLTIATRLLSLDPIEAAGLGLDTGTYALLAISDTGLGMTIEEQRHIFEPFYTTKADSGGMGLGLWVVYRSLQQQSGKIRVASAPGQGTSFSIYVPALDIELLDVASGK